MIKLIVLCLLILPMIVGLIFVAIAMTKEANRLKTREADNKLIEDQYHELLEYEAINHILPTPPPSRNIGISGCSYLEPHENQKKHFNDKNL